MAGASNRVADGVTLTAGTSSWSAELTDFDWSGITRASIDMTHLGVAAPSANTFGNMISKPSDLSDPGSLSITGNYDPDTIPPIDAEAEIWTLTFDQEGSDSTDSALAGSGYMTDFSFTGSVGAKVGFTATIKFTGPITRTAAA